MFFVFLLIRTITYKEQIVEKSYVDGSSYNDTDLNKQRQLFELENVAFCGGFEWTQVPTLLDAGGKFVE